MLTKLTPPATPTAGHPHGWLRRLGQLIAVAVAYQRPGLPADQLPPVPDRTSDRA